MCTPHVYFPSSIEQAHTPKIIHVHEAFTQPHGPHSPLSSVGNREVYQMKNCYEIGKHSLKTPCPSLLTSLMSVITFIMVITFVSATSLVGNCFILKIFLAEIKKDPIQQKDYERGYLPQMLPRLL
jgi:hypothetical protein